MSHATDDDRDITPLDLHDTDFDLMPTTKPTIFPQNTFDPFAPLFGDPTHPATPMSQE